MNIFSPIKSMALPWRAYFIVLLTVFMAGVMLMTWLIMSSHGVDSGIGVVYGLFYLLCLARFIGFNFLIYRLGAKWPILRKILAVVVVVAVIMTLVSVWLRSNAQSTYEAKYRPLSFDEARQRILACEVIAITTAANGYTELKFTNGTSRKVERYIDAEDLRSIQGSVSCFAGK